MQAYQTIDDSIPAGSSPYRRLPQLSFYGHRPSGPFGLTPSLIAQTTYFDRNESVSGARVDIEPAVTLPILRSFLDVLPKIAVRHTEYLLDDPNRGGALARSPGIVCAFAAIEPLIVIRKHSPVR